MQAAVLACTASSVTLLARCKQRAVLYSDYFQILHGDSPLAIVHMQISLEPVAPSSLVPASGPGLRLSWIVYRGKAADVTFSPDQMKTWTDTRAYANSPWSPPYFIPEVPPENKWIVQATFREPGTYVLRAVASDGAVFTYDNVTVSVTR